MPAFVAVAAARRMPGRLARPVASGEVAGRAEPFRSGEEAWFWTMACLAARRDGARFASGLGRRVRPCDPDDVVRCLDELYRRRRITLAHARVLRAWGERQAAPDARYPAERNEASLWAEALGRLEFPLRLRGIVG